MDWKKTGKDKADSLLQSIPQEWKIAQIPSAEDQRDITGPYIQRFLNKQEIEITESDATDIVNSTTTGKWSAVDVAKAFCHRAAIAHQHVKCLHEFFHEAAIADAEALDKYFAEHKKPIGPLHGLPVSLKDQFHVKNVETSMVSLIVLGLSCTKRDLTSYRDTSAGWEPFRGRKEPARRRSSNLLWSPNCEVWELFYTSKRVFRIL